MRKRNYKLIFGIPNPLPTLPIGWVYLLSSEDYLKAVDRDGKVYYVGQEYAYPARPSPSGRELWLQSANPETWVRMPEIGKD